MSDPLVNGDGEHDRQHRRAGGGLLTHAVQADVAQADEQEPPGFGRNYLSAGWHADPGWPAAG
jgi:hypothetical protein